MYAEVIVEYNSKQIDKTFTYLIPQSLKDILTKGMKVIVPFGNKEINGFVLKITNEKQNDVNLKAIINIVTPEFVLTDELLALGDYMQQKTFCSRITAYQTMLPTSLKIKDSKSNYNRYDTSIELNLSITETKEYITINSRCHSQNKILEELIISNSINKKLINNSSLKTLLEKGIVKETKTQTYRLNCLDQDNLIKPKLTIDQSKAIAQITFDKHQVHLLHGVTGSGKTEVYMSLIDQVVLQGKSAIMLVPEITLTVQTVQLFQARFGQNVAIFHSGLSIGEKNDEYLKILRGEVKIVIGTRSAIFVPLKDLGIIIIDEEHSDTYKQDNNPRYHVLDMATFRAKYHQIPLLLASATPSLESMARAQKGVYNLISMPNRIGQAVLPKTYIVDMIPEMKKRNMIFSEILKTKINDRLTKNEQVILLLNRRGFSTTITCQSCGETIKCPNCEITLTYHKTNENLRCHYCGYTIFKPEECPKCHEAALNYFGLGTEKLEGEINRYFPKARVVRMDMDTTQNKGQHQKIIEDYQNHQYDILVGTQMISKGLDFPLVTLVGVINADSSLNIPDFRSSERTFQLLHQVAGRAGRSNLPGEVIIQTFNPDNYTLKCVSQNNYLDFYQYEMHNRQILKYTPYYFMTSIKIASYEYELASKEATKVKQFLVSHLKNEEILLGPTTAAMFKSNNVYRFQIIIKYKQEAPVFRVLTELLAIYQLNKKVNLEIDNSPLRI